MSKNFRPKSDPRGGAVNSGLRGLVRDDRAKRQQAAMRGNAALLASLKPSDDALAKARAKVAREAAAEAEAAAWAHVDSLYDAANGLSDELPWPADSAVTFRDVTVERLVPVGAVRLTWDRHVAWGEDGWQECTFAVDLLPLVEEAIAAWAAWRAALEAIR